MARQAKNDKKENAFGSFIQASGQARNNPLGEKIAVAGQRETGRRSREGFTQVAGYVPADLYRQVKKKLFDENRNFSELLENWMHDYVVK